MSSRILLFCMFLLIFNAADNDDVACIRSYREGIMKSVEVMVH